MKRHVSGRPHRVAPTADASKCRFPRVPTKRQRSAFCGKEEAPAPKAKVFRRKTEQLRRAPTTSRRYSRSICPVFVGAPLRGRPSMRKISFQSRPRRHATNFVHFAALLLMTGSSFSQKALLFGNPAVHSTAYNALLTRSSACKFRVKAQPCFGRPRRVAPTADASKYGFHRAE